MSTSSMTARLLTTASVLALFGAGAAHAQAPAADGAELEAIVVTGSRLSSGFTAPTPVTVIGAQQLETRALSSVGEALNEAPAFRPGGLSQAGGGTFTTGQQQLDLRGLGATRTLVLIDGQRPTPVNVDGTYDVNMIPTNLIDRTEVVTGGASAAYGSDAVAGVVNFILRDRLEGIRANVQYGTSQESDATELSGGIAIGRAFLDGRLHIIAGGDYSNQDPTKTLYSRDWGEREPGVVNLAARPAGIPANIVGYGSEYQLAPGGLITGCTRGATVLQAIPPSATACPLYGTTFDSNGRPVPFQFGPYVGSNTMFVLNPTPGQNNYGVSPIAGYRMRAGGERKNFLTRATFDVTPNLTVYGQFQYGWFQVTSYGNVRVRNNNQIFINRDNPYLPAALATQMDAQGITQIRMNRVLNEFGVANPRNRNKTRQFTVGARGTLFESWRWDASYATGRTEFDFQVFGTPQLPNFYASIYAVRNPQGQIVCGPTETNPNRTLLTAAQLALISPGCQPTNLFGSGSLQQSAIDYFMPGAMQQFTVFDRDSANLNVSGELFQLPAGPIVAAVGAEWHKDSVVVTVDPRTEALSRAQAFFVVNPLPGVGELSAKELYGEIGIPVFRDVGFDALDLNAAVRRTDYSTSGGVTTWKVGATWDINDDLRFRATRSRDIRAPNITELFIRGNDSNGVRVNPLTGVSAQLNGSTAPNPNLTPEIANTFTGGVVFQPSFFSGLRFSADYYSIKIRDVIGSLAFNEVLERYFLRGDQDMARFITLDNSAIGFSRVESPRYNLSSQIVSGIDVELAYRAPENVYGIPGQFNFSALGSYLDQLETFDEKGNTLGNLAGYIPKWRWNFTVDYTLGRFGTSLQARTFTKVRYRLDRIGPDDPTYSPALTNSVNRNVFPGLTYFNLSARYNVIDSNGRRLQAYGVIDNLLDRDPPGGAWGIFTTQGQGGSAGYNPYDGVGRYFKVGLRLQY
jgi:iron complex outermembrane receptor protein